MGGLNVTACVMHESGFATLLDITLIVAGDIGACRTSSGTSLLDYVLVDNALAGLIPDMFFSVGCHGGRTPASNSAY